jgi:putative flavoprotein involved in K+ transport
VDAVIWATGYRSDFAWIEAPVFGEDRQVLHRRGVTDVPGLYFLGLSWQHTRGSALIGWVKDDAEFIAARIEAFRHERRAKQESDESATSADTKEGA